MSHHHQLDISPDDPRLTAYALGELEGEDLPAIAAAVAADSELQQAVAEIRNTADQLSSALATEPIPAASPIPLEPYHPPAPVVRFPVWLAGGLVAALFALLIVLIRPSQRPESPAATPSIVRVDTGPRPGAGENRRERALDPTLDPTAEQELRTAEVLFGDDGTTTAQERESEKADNLFLLDSAERTFSTTTGSLLAASNDGARDTRDTLSAGEDLTIAGADEVLSNRGSSLPRPPLIAASGRTESLLAAGSESDGRFESVFPVRSPAEELSAAGPRSLDSRIVFTSDPDVATNAAVAVDALADEATPPSRTALFVYDRNRQNVNLRSMLAPAATSQPVEGTPETAPTSLVLTSVPVRESAPDESLRDLLSESFQMAVGLRLPHLTTEDLATTVAYDASAYDVVEDNEFLSAGNFPLSTVPLDVDSRSYANIRRFLASNQRPPRGAVRIEELINYFDYDYAPPATSSDDLFNPAFEVADAPWSRDHRLVRVGLRSRDAAEGERLPANLVFLIDVSGSMDAPNKIHLIKTSLRMLVDRLRPSDRLAFVVFSSRAGVALPSTPVGDRVAVERAIDRLAIGAAGEESDGLALAYHIADANYVPHGINRVVLTTDGEMGADPDFWERAGERAQEDGLRPIALTVLGYGMRSTSADPLVAIRNAADHAFAHVNSPREARRAVTGPALWGGSTLAEDVRVQVEFNPARVQAYRLIGYENSRLPQSADGSHANLEADVVPGHAITTLYEVVPAGVDWKPPATMTDRWIEVQRNRTSARSTDVFKELLTVKLRYVRTTDSAPEVVEYPLFDDSRSFASASADFKFTSAVAAFGMMMRDSPHRGSVELGQIENWAHQGLGADPEGYRSEFIGLLGQARSMIVR